MRRKTSMRKKIKDISASVGESTQNTIETVKENENEIDTSNASSSKSGRKKRTPITSKQSSLNGLESSSKEEETKSKKTVKQKDDIKTKNLQIILERCEEPDESDELETGETSEPSVENEEGKVKSVPKGASKGTKRKRGNKGDDGCEEPDESDELETGETSEPSVENEEGKVKSVPKGASKGTKRKRGNKGDDDVKPSKSAKEEKQPNSKSAQKKEKIPDVTSIDFGNQSKSPNGTPWNFKIASWNINGIRAWLEKNGVSFLHHEKPDILCVQETKCSDNKLPDEMKKVEGYHTYWLAGDKDGYSGVGLLSKEEPINMEYGIGISEHDNEGRVITAEYEQFYLVAAYVPNAGRGLVRLDYRMKWDKDFREYLKKLDDKKPVILCGDLNVAHEEIDLANPKTNKKNAGFTKEEREGFSTLLGEGFIDSFRRLYPDLTGAYTFWTYMMNARAKNVGWRLDYFVLSERFCEKLCDNVIRKDVLGSDHCPITLFLSL